MRRIHISNRYGIKEFRRIVLNRGLFVQLLKIKQFFTATVRVLIGENMYMGIYKVIFGVR